LSPAHVRRDMRKHSRRTVELPVVVSDAANRVKAGIRFGAADVSIGGAFLASDLLFEVGEVLDVTIDLATRRRIVVRGRVVRVSRGTSSGEVPGMGIEFVGLSSADRTALESVLR